MHNISVRRCLCNTVKVRYIYCILAELTKIIFYSYKGHVVSISSKGVYTHRKKTSQYIYIYIYIYMSSFSDVWTCFLLQGFPANTFSKHARELASRHHMQQGAVAHEWN